VDLYVTPSFLRILCTQVKGLFCEVPRDCLEHMIVYGFSANSRSDMNATMFKESWFQVWDIEDLFGS
jgi:hypothetical protein